MTRAFQLQYDRSATGRGTRPNKSKVSANGLIRWSGLATMVGGFIFAGIQPIHPADVLSSVTTNAWTIIIALKLAMCLLFLLGITGLYARQADRAGWLGLGGYLLLSLSWFLQTGFVFAEIFILPLLAPVAPQFVDSYLGVVNGFPGEMDIGALGPVYGAVGIAYLLGGLMFGIATLRAGLLPRWPAILMIVTAAITPAAALLPHDIQRFAAVPMGISLFWLGFAMWSERRRGIGHDMMGNN